MANEYKIKNLSDIAKLDDGQIDNFLIDLKAWFVLVKTSSADLPDFLKLVTSEMIWVDDDRNGELSGVNLRIEAKGE